MAYPFASFGSFLFRRSESPLPETDTGWNINPNVSRAKILGSTVDSIVALSIGSSDRSFECLLSPTRFAALYALVNTEASFVDWERPDPDHRNAYLANVEKQGFVGVMCSDGTTQKRIRTKVTLVST